MFDASKAAGLIEVNWTKPSSSVNGSLIDIFNNKTKMPGMEQSTLKMCKRDENWYNHILGGTLWYNLLTSK